MNPFSKLMRNRMAALRLAASLAAAASLMGCATGCIGYGAPETAVKASADSGPPRSQTKYLRPEDHTGFSDRGSPEDFGEAEGGIAMLPPGHPLIVDFQLHGITWPMVENVGSSRVYAPQEGICSYYWQDEKVATGERFDPSGMTAAHISLPFGTLVRCTRKDNGRSVTVTINDRGPYVEGRILDLSKGAAEKIGLHVDGITPVVVEVLAYPLVELMGPKGNG